MRILHTLLLAAVAVTPISCASKKILTSQAVSTDRLFPDGSYHHGVRLTIPVKSASGEMEEKKFSFNGVVQLKPEAIRVVALTPFGTTAFKLTEDLKTGEIKSEIFVEQMKKLEPRLKQYYQVVRKLLLAPSHIQKADGLDWTRLSPAGSKDAGLPLEIRIHHENVQAPVTSFTFLKYDEHHIPERVHVESPAFKADIEVSEYEI